MVRALFFSLQDGEGARPHLEVPSIRVTVSRHDWSA